MLDWKEIKLRNCQEQDESVAKIQLLNQFFEVGRPIKKKKSYDRGEEEANQ